MIRELAENPNVHQPLGPGRELVVDPAGRFALYLAPGMDVHDATVQRVRLSSGAVEEALDEIRALLRARGRRGSEWELGESSTPDELVTILLELGLERDEHEPEAVGMALDGRAGWEAPSDVEARPVRSVAELVAARRIQGAAFGDASAPDLERVRRDFDAEGQLGSTFVALLDGEIVAAGYASYTPHGSILFGGATREDARGRGAYRALVAARADEAKRRGAPTLVVHAGRMSRPILERLGFRPVSRIDRLLDRV